jgi:lipopolysaccharide transport system ATP-binding protein
VLAVGDSEFQKKCLGKMDEVSRKESRTVLFVSHNMSAITQLCKKVVLLESGKIKEIGEPETVVSNYLNTQNLDNNNIDLSKYSNRNGTGDIFFKTAWIENKRGEKFQNFSIGDDISIVFIISPGKNYFCENNLFAIKIRRSDGLQLSNILNRDSKYKIGKLNKDTKFSVNFKDIRLYPGKYYISLWAGCINGAETLDRVEDCLSFNIIDGGNLTTRPLPNNSHVLFLTPEWKLE